MLLRYCQQLDQIASNIPTTIDRKSTGYVHYAGPLGYKVAFSFPRGDGRCFYSVLRKFTINIVVLS